MISALEERFCALTGDLFAFLERDHGFVREAPRMGGVSDLVITLRGPRVDIDVLFSEENEIWINVTPLTDGRRPERFDADLREHWVEYAASDLLTELDGQWRAPERQFSVASVEDIKDVLRAYSDAIRRHVVAIIDPEADVLARVAKARNREYVLRALREWTEFVDEVRRGFDRGIGFYTSSIAGRSNLEDADWSDPFTSEPRRQLEEVDGLFDEATEPTPWRAQPGAVLPLPRAARWWRKPRILRDSMRAAFRGSEP